MSMPRPVPPPPTAASEFARVLRPGALLALSDVTADPERLPIELTGLGAWVACIADAKPLDEVVTVLEEAGLHVEKAEQRDRLLADIVSRVEARLRLARFIGAPLGEGLEAPILRGLELIPAVRAAIADGALGYGVIVARR